MRHVDPQRHRILFSLGIGLILLSFPVGWAGGLGFAAAAVASGDSRWLLVALGIYLASWLIMGLGVLIAGRAGRERAREILRRRRRLREILLHRRRRREGRDGAGLNPPESDPP